MSEPQSPAIPAKVQAIGIMHLIGGLMNVMTVLVWVALFTMTVVFSLGLGLIYAWIYCCPIVVLLPVAVLEIISGVKHLSHDHTGLQRPQVAGIAEVCGVLGCSVFSLVFGVLTLVFLSDPEVDAYYASRQLPG